MQLLKRGAVVSLLTCLVLETLKLLTEQTIITMLQSNNGVFPFNKPGTAQVGAISKAQKDS